MDWKAAFEKHDDEFLKFDRVENPLSPRPDLCAFLLLHSLAPSNSDMVTSAEHDEIWLNVDLELLSAVISDDDIKTLVRCGVHYDEEVDSMAMFA